MGKDDSIPAAIQEPGPHGFANRWVLYFKTCRTIKFGTSGKTPTHYVECHRFWRWRPWQILHASAHKHDKSPPILAVYKPKRAWPASMFVGPKDFVIKFPGGDNNGQDIDIKMMRTKLGLLAGVPQGYEFSMPVEGGGGTERFEWRKADWGSHCEEIKLSHKEDDPPVHTGDARPPREEGLHFTKPYSGWMLVRLDGPNKINPEKERPLGYTEQGEEIVATWANASGWVASRKIIFTFWGTGSKGELGETFTRVAAMTGSAIWDDEERRRAARRARQNAAHNNS